MSAPDAMQALSRDDAMRVSDSGWQTLPPRSRVLFIVSTALGVALTALIAGAMLNALVLRARSHALPLACLPIGLLLGGWYGIRRYLNTRWRIDRDGFALRRGKLWEVETRVPGSRVQHLDLKRGPLERHYRLATLVIHTAGTRHTAVALSGLDVGDAETLRDRLARQTDDDDGDA